MKQVQFPNGKKVLPLCINLHRSPDRRQSVQEQMDAVGFPINFSEGVDRLCMTDESGNPLPLKRVVFRGGDLSDALVDPMKIVYTRPEDGKQEVYDYIPPRMINSRYQPYVTEMYAGLIGSQCAHQKCFKAFKESDADFAFIVEDDIGIAKIESGYLYSRIEPLLTEQFDFCLVGKGFHRDYAPAHNGYSNDLVYETAYQYYSGASGYILSRDGVEKIHKILPTYNTIFSGIDEFFGLCQVDFGFRILAVRDKFFGLKDDVLLTTMCDHKQAAP